jgi:hypothetical protein
MSDIDRLILIFVGILLLWLLVSIRGLLKRIADNTRVTITQVDSISLDIEALRDKYAPLSTD